MSLRDTSCYTLLIRPSAEDQAISQLVEPPASIDSREEPRYARVKEKREGEAYSAVIYDALTGAVLASAGYETERSRKRRLQLHGPDEDVLFEQTGKLNFEWTFTFENNKYRWTRELYGKDYILSLDRKPDPKVEICLAREADKANPGRLQILHYNIDRFPDDICDLKGLETLVVASLLCLFDATEERNGPLRSLSGQKVPSAQGSTPPPKPPSPPRRVISADDFEPENPNEIVVGTDTVVDDHIARAVGLLEDPKILFIVVRTKTAAAAQRALEVSLGVTRFRHRERLADLHQYVIEEENVAPQSPGPKVIKLDEPSRPDPSPRGWSPPKNIAIYLSTIELPDLKPGRREHLSAKPTASPKAISPVSSPDLEASSKGPKGSIGKLFRH